VGNSCVEGREVKYFNVSVWRIVVGVKKIINNNKKRNDSNKGFSETDIIKMLEFFLLTTYLLHTVGERVFIRVLVKR
jgi:hypothetical protein